MHLLPLLLALPLSPELHVDEIHGFQIDVPAGWIKNEQDGGSEGFVCQLLPPGTLGERGVTVTVVHAGSEIDARDLFRRTKAVLTGERSAEFSGLEEFEVDLLGERAPGIRVTYEAPGAGEFRIEQTYAVEAELGYLLQIHAPLAEFEQRKAELGAVLATFAFVEAGEAAEAERRLIELAEKCGSEVDWAKTWDEAAERARDEDKLILVCASLIPGFSISDSPLNSTFVDEDVIGLVNERFVPLWYERGADAPFVESYGMSATTFGEGLLLVTPGGEVVLQTHVASYPDVVYPFLRAGLARNPELAGTPVDDELAPLARAERHAARGEHEEAWKLVEGDESAAAHRLRAKLLRLERRGQEALAALAAARAAGDPAEAELLVEEAALRLREGERDRARELLDRAIADHAGTDAAHAASLLRGVLDLPEEREAAKRRWRELTETAPESRWAWQAAAALRSTFLELDVEPYHGWPKAEVLDELLSFPSKAPLKTSRARGAAEEAFAWLVAAQREDGSWSTPSELASPAGMGPDDATTAICGRALLAHAARGTNGEAENAARRALAFVLASAARRAEEPPLVVFMDYMTWSDSMMLHFFADALEAGLGDVEVLAPAADALLKDLASRQREGGGWSYYVASNVEGGGAPSNSISFTTAAAVLALARAQRAGLRVPEELLEPAVGALERMRGESGVFAYFLFHDSGALESGTADPGAVGRGPACELALHNAGKSSKKRLKSALEKFLAQRHLYSAEQGKAFMHAGPHAQGSHYLLFDYAHAALVHDELGRDTKSRTQLLELVLDCRQPDGSFVDTPLLGRAYGTAMALLALDALE